MSRYTATGSQGDFEPGSNNLVLKNKLGIVLPEDMDDAELGLLEQLYEDVLVEHLPTDAITVAQIKAWHRNWLGNIYAWAGEERSVNMSKDNFHFAVAGQIPNLLSKLEANYLTTLTPCTDLDDEQLIAAIATVHVEFILIHPFRDGNGRISRLLADVMAVQAGYDPLDYSAWDADKSAYVGAIHQGFNGDYVPMMKWVERAFAGI